MAYMIELKQYCKRCARQAMVEVYNGRNAPMGKFCREHGRECLKDLEKREAEDATHYPKRLDTES